MEEDKHEVIYDENISGARFIEAIATQKPDVLIVKPNKITAAEIDANPGLSLIIKAGSGYDTIDVAHASEKGVYVVNCPGKNATAVAELTMGLIISIDRRL